MRLSPASNPRTVRPTRGAARARTCCAPAAGVGLASPHGRRGAPPSPRARIPPPPPLPVPRRAARRARREEGAPRRAAGLQQPCRSPPPRTSAGSAATCACATTPRWRRRPRGAPTPWCLSSCGRPRRRGSSRAAAAHAGGTLHPSKEEAKSMSYRREGAPPRRLHRPRAAVSGAHGVHAAQEGRVPTRRALAAPSRCRGIVPAQRAWRAARA